MKIPILTEQISLYDKKKHHKKARQIALETAVLLKNEAELLPLNREQNIAVIGEFANMGRYSEKKIARMLYWAVALSQKGLLLINKKETAANAEFILNLPYRGIGRMSGIFSDRQVENLLKKINNKKINKFN